MRSLRPLLLAAGLIPALAPAGPLPYKAVPAFPGLPAFREPVLLLASGDGSGRLYVVEREGRVHSFHPGAPDQVRLFLDIRGRARTANPEEGLLSLAFHPRYKANRRVFTVYTRAKVVPRRTRISEWVSADYDESVDLGSEKVLLEVEKKHGNHNGSTLAFGQDGKLYISLGDGGGGGDQDGNAQDLNSWLGKVLRLDVDSGSSAGKAYGIPKDNPFASKAGGRPELWAWGLRNVWRMSFDPATGELWAGDVGQNAWEEINVLKKGGNYGWNWREGAHAFARGKAPQGLLEPVHDYSRKDGSCVTGGVVYRGRALPGLQGKYLFADFVSRKVWAMDAKAKSSASVKQIALMPEMPSSFGVDEAGEVYLVGYEGTIFKLAGAQ